METRKWGSDGGFNPRKRSEELDAVLDGWEKALKENEEFISRLKETVK